jgi:hypothetical protein
VSDAGGGRLEYRRDHGQRHQPDRQVDVEDPLPGEVVDEEAAEQPGPALPATARASARRRPGAPVAAGPRWRRRQRPRSSVHHCHDGDPHGAPCAQRRVVGDPAAAYPRPLRPTGPHKVFTNFDIGAYRAGDHRADHAASAHFSWNGHSGCIRSHNGDVLWWLPPRVPTHRISQWAFDWFAPISQGRRHARPYHTWRR